MKNTTDKVKIRKIRASKKDKLVKPVTDSLVGKSEGVSLPDGKYVYAVGKRKTAVGTLRVFQNGTGTITINNKDYTQYFPQKTLQELILQPLIMCGKKDIMDCTIYIKGGGINGQVSSIRNALAKALVNLDENLRLSLRSAGLLTRDARIKERKKYGLKRARRAPQWTKR